MFGILANFEQAGLWLVISLVVSANIERFRISRGTVGIILTRVRSGYTLPQFPSGLFATGSAGVASSSLDGQRSRVSYWPPHLSCLLFGAFAISLSSDAGLYTSIESLLLTKLFGDTCEALWLRVSNRALARFVTSETAALRLVVQ
jgi:hypothetical protein